MAQEVKLLIFAGEVVIGTTNFGTGDDSKGVMYACFIPLPGYDKVQSVFRLFTDAAKAPYGEEDGGKLDAYYHARDALGLSIKTEAGTQLPVSVVHIEDFSVELGEIMVTAFTANFMAIEACRAIISGLHM